MESTSIHPRLHTPPLSTPSRRPPFQDPDHWNSILKQQARLKNDKAILNAYTHMESLHILPDSASLPLIFKACSNLRDIETGKKVHSNIKTHHFIHDVRVRTALVDFYCKCGLLVEARHLFDEKLDRDVIFWNAMINGCVGCSSYDEALILFRRMVLEDFKPSSRTLVALLMACGELPGHKLGLEIHGYCLRNGILHSNYHLWTALMSFYTRFDVTASRAVFDSMATTAVVCWNAMMTAYFDAGDHLGVLTLFLKMLTDGIVCDNVTMLLICQACEHLESLKLGMQIHQLAIKWGYVYEPYAVNALINMYSRIACIESTRKLFDSAPKHDIAIWNSILSAYSEFRDYEGAFKILPTMQSEGIQMNPNTIRILLQMCAQSATTDLRLAALQLHAKVVRSGFNDNTEVGNGLLSMYAKINHLEEALKVFRELKSPDVISYNTIISVLADNGHRSQAWDYFCQIEVSETKANSHTIIALLASCKDESSLNIGRSLHGYAVKHNSDIDVEMSTALTGMYINCGDHETAKILFQMCPNKDIISWNSLIASYVRNNLADKAVSLLSSMISQFKPNSVTIINILSSCTYVACLPLGKCLHAYAIRGLILGESNISLENALLSMYARCGCIQYAERILQSMEKKSIVSWNAIIAGYGLNGRVGNAFHAFSQMMGEGLNPNNVTFLLLLSACAHEGLVKKGFQLFKSMVSEYNIIPEMFHYGCLVDLLGRAGYLYEAKDIVDSMPFEPDTTVLRSLLSSCRPHANLELAKSTFEKLVQLEPTNATNYIALSNIYAGVGLWSEVSSLRTQLKEKIRE